MITIAAFDVSKKLFALIIYMEMVMLPYLEKQFLPFRISFLRLQIYIFFQISERQIFEIYQELTRTNFALG